ncbi:MAG TPA: permease-like cell division protein FtsX [Myxococcota bacterium]|nr:permease-like cell division protein FtsX [Myxococcota bacterium]
MIDARSTRRIAAALRAGARGARERPLVFGLAVATMAAGLLVLGTYLLVIANLRGVLARAGADLRLVAFTELRGAESDDAVTALAAKLRAQDGVASLDYVSPAAALERLRNDLGQDAGALDGLDRNPLPGSFELAPAAGPRDPASLRGLADRVAAVPGVTEVRWGEPWVEGYARAVRIAEWIGAALGVFLLLVLGTIVASTVRLSLHARADEIQIQRLVGAGGWFVRLPFCLEGALQGLLAAGLALAVLRGLFALGLPLLGDALSWLLGGQPAVFFGPAESALLVALGVALGTGGALASLVNLDERA